MVKLLRKAKLAIKNPSQTLPYINQQFRTFQYLIIRGEYSKAILTLGNEITSVDRFVEDNWSSIIKEVNGSKMVLNLRDRGINRELLLNGTREEVETAEFSNQLDRINEEYESISVLDIGANIGYYVLLEAAILGNEHKIYAFEPHPQNVSQLRESISLNGFNEFVEVEQCAIGSENGTAELAVSTYSNTHQISNDKARTSSTIDVEVKSIDSIVSERDLRASNCLVFRVDVEGFEYEVFKGMKEQLAYDIDILLFIEVHGSVPQNNKEKMLQKLSDSGFEFIYASNQSADSIVDLHDSSSFHLIAQRTT